MCLAEACGLSGIILERLEMLTVPALPRGLTSSFLERQYNPLGKDEGPGDALSGFRSHGPCGLGQVTCPLFSFVSSVCVMDMLAVPAAGLL